MINVIVTYLIIKQNVQLEFFFFNLQNKNKNVSVILYN